MDNFGIFKILNSFYNFYESKKSDSAAKNDGGEKENVDKSSPESQNSGDILSSLKNAFFSSGKRNAQKTETKPQSVIPSLNAKMTFTMSRHDEIVKRVMDNAKKTASPHAVKKPRPPVRKTADKTAEKITQVDN